MSPGPLEKKSSEADLTATINGNFGVNGIKACRAFKQPVNFNMKKLFVCIHSHVKEGIYPITPPVGRFCMLFNFPTILIQWKRGNRNAPLYATHPFKTWPTCTYHYNFIIGKTLLIPQNITFQKTIFSYSMP